MRCISWYDLVTDQSSEALSQSNDLSLQQLSDKSLHAFLKEVACHDEAKKAMRDIVLKPATVALEPVNLGSKLHCSLIIIPVRAYAYLR